MTATDRPARSLPPVAASRTRAMLAVGAVAALAFGVLAGCDGPALEASAMLDLTVQDRAVFERETVYLPDQYPAPTGVAEPAAPAF